jgi:hypothetical protein
VATSFLADPLQLRERIPDRVRLVARVTLLENGAGERCGGLLDVIDSAKETSEMAQAALRSLSSRSPVNPGRFMAVARWRELCRPQACGAPVPHRR